MSFCGQCGFQLAPDDTRCPRCGAAVEPEAVATQEEEFYHPDAATRQSLSLSPSQKTRATRSDSQHTTIPPSATGQQKLILGADGINTQEANEATSMMEAPIYQPSNPRLRASYPGYPPQNTGYHAPNDVYAYPPQSGAGYPYLDEGVPYQQPAPRRNGGRTTGLIMILLGILLILSALILFTLQHNGVIGGAAQNSTPTTTATGTAANPATLAQAVVQHYYDSVNKQDYNTAYHLWKNNTQKFTDFENGYKNTKHTDVVFGTVTVQKDGKVYVPVTLKATEQVPNKQTTRLSNYIGHYLVEKQADGTWLIFDGDLKLA